MNLATNSYHALEGAVGELRVALQQVRINPASPEYPKLLPGTYVRLRVTDNGRGIEKNNIDKVFDPYFTTKEAGKGTGLGLSVVHGIVKVCGGDIRIYSELGKGTDVHVFIPIGGSQVEWSIEFAEQIKKGTERVLLVDDEAFVAETVKQLLEHLGYQVTIRFDSVEALNVFETRPDSFDLVITDMTMPNMTGVQLARKIHHMDADIPIIICTGFTDQISEEICRDFGIQGYLMKPVALRELAETIRKVLGKKEALE